jgi:hypothetical protein
MPNAQLDRNGVLRVLGAFVGEDLVELVGEGGLRFEPAARATRLRRPPLRVAHVHGEPALAGRSETRTEEPLYVLWSSSR